MSRTQQQRALTAPATTTVTKAADRIYERIAGLQGCIKCVEEATASNNASADSIRQEIPFAMGLLYRECAAILAQLQESIIEPLQDSQ